MLPVDSFLPSIRQTLAEHRNLVLVAEPGAGKTTRVPPALLDRSEPRPPRRQGGDPRGRVYVLEPRRLAARLAAQRVADELGEPLGHSSGYQVRHEACFGAHTRILFVTEGLLLRRLLTDPDLADASRVVIDEFHERHLHGDVCLAILRRLQKTRRPDLGLLVMSATLDPHPVAAFLGDCPVITVPGQPFPLTVHHAPHADPAPLELQVAKTVRDALDQPGDILAFLPGAADIRRARDACQSTADLEVRTLHGDMPLDQQRQALAASPRRKLILATNVAESSITVPGVRTVVDSGLARILHHSVWSGLPQLSVDRISQASATQRAGRAARLGPGRVFRLFTRADFDSRARYDVPEIRRADLADVVLSLLAIDIEPAELQWFEAPSESGLAAAHQLLVRLGAVHHDSITALGREMLALPLHPRLARLVVEGSRLGVGESAGMAAALLSSRDIFSAEVGSDIADRVTRYQKAAASRFDADTCRTLGMDRLGALAVERLCRQLDPAPEAASQPPDRFFPPAAPQGDRLPRAILAGFPDRIGHRPRAQQATVLLSNGTSAELRQPGPYTWLVAVEAEQRHDRGRQAATTIRLASPLQPDWLLEAYWDRIGEERRIEYNPSTGKVEQRDIVRYDDLVLEERSGPAPPGLQRTAALAAAAARLADRADVASWRERYRFVQTLVADLPDLTDAEVQAALARVCEPWTRLAEVEQAVERGALLTELSARLDPPGRLERLAPLVVRLPRRPKVPVHYEAGRPPWIESRLQDFIGARQGPRIGGGQVPLVLHLLAPNGRAVQVTTDLPGFWERIYPQIRPGLMRRYPRHDWPENVKPPTTSERGS